MFWTAFVWGMGATVGGSIGLMLFVVLFACFKTVTQSKAVKAIESFHERSHQALLDRNKLTLQTIEHLATIAAATERYEDSITAKESR